MKYQVLYSLKKKTTKKKTMIKYLRMSSAVVVTGTLRANNVPYLPVAYASSLNPLPRSSTSYV